MVTQFATNVHKYPLSGYIDKVFSFNRAKNVTAAQNPRTFQIVPGSPHCPTDDSTLYRSMKGILLFALLLLAISATSLGISAALPSPDGALFAIAILLSAAFTAVSLCIELGEGRINDMRDVIQVIETGRSWRLTLAAYALGCSLAAAVTVLVYRSVIGG